MTEPHALLTRKPPIAVLTLSRPEVKNTFSDGMLRLWQQYLQEAQHDDSIQVIVVTGKGNGICAGGDVHAFAQGALTSWKMKRYLWEAVHRVPLTLEDMNKPVFRGP
jgi:enoyl-CoA hydratase/carnithine racemase